MQSPSHIRASLLRVRAAFERKPASARQADAPALAVWQGGLAVQAAHPCGAAVHTDLPESLGGTGGAPSPGWYSRAALATCTASSIAMEAALRGVVLQRLEVQAHSESDARGLLGDPGVPSGPVRVWMTVVLAAAGVPEAELHALVAAADAHSPVADGLRRATEVTVDVQPVANPES